MHLPRKDVLVSVVVGNARERRRIGVEADRALGGAIAAIAPDQLLGQVKRLRRRAPVARGVQRAACVQSVVHLGGDLRDLGDLISHRTVRRQTSVNPLIDPCFVVHVAGRSL